MKKETLYFCGGFAFGAAVASFVTYYITMKKAEKDFWGDVKEDELEDFDDGINSSYIDIERKENDPPKKYETPPEIREKLLKNWNKPPLNVSEEEMAENTHPVDSDEDDLSRLDATKEEEAEYNNDDDRIEGVEKDGPSDIAYEADEYHKLHVNDPPEIISEDEVGSVPPHFDTQEWIFWVEDGVMTDEDEQVIEDYERFVGDTIDKSEFRNNDEEETFVLSYEYDTLYHIIKYFQSYTGKMAEENGYIASEEG